MKTRFHFIAVCAAVLLQPFIVAAQGILIDQSYSPSGIYSYWSLSYPGATPIGQEFVPALSSLDFVDLRLYGGGGSATGTFEVRIHSGSISAPILAASSPASTTDGMERVTHFEFGAPVTLTPGSTYVIELAQLSAGSEWGVAEAFGGGYDAGRMLWGGLPSSQGRDLWFQEGVAVPEPGVISLCMLGVGFYLILRRRHPPNSALPPTSAGRR